MDKLVCGGRRRALVTAPLSGERRWAGATWRVAAAVQQAPRPQRKQQDDGTGEHQDDPDHVHV
jgi:hypothetical protein